MERSIQEVARLAGTTSRTLRHYHRIGLLEPSRIAANGYRQYDDAALVRLQRILLLRQLGLGLPEISGVLAQAQPATDALAVHLSLLRQEQERLARQIAAVAATIERLEGGGDPMAEEMFDGFEHTRYQDEVTQRWGADAYARGDRWWRAMTPDQRAEWQRDAGELAAAWRDASGRGIPVDSAEAQDLAARHVRWLTGIPGTPAADGEHVREYVIGLGEMYVADPRFAATYGGEVGAAFVRDALRAHAQERL